MAAPANRSPIKNHAYRAANTPGGAYPAAALVGTYYSLEEFRRCVFIAVVGPLAADVTMEVMEAQDASGTGAQELTAVSTGETFTNGTDEGRVGVLEIVDTDLSSGYTHVACRITGDGTNTVAVIAELLDKIENPVSNTESDGVAFAQSATIADT